MFEALAVLIALSGAICIFSWCKKAKNKLVKKKK